VVLNYKPNAYHKRYKTYNCNKQTITWQAIEGAVSYILQYALEGDWETGGVYVNNISGTSYVLSVAPGEYAYRVIAMDSDGKAIGSWSEEQEVEILFHDEQTLHISGNSSRSQAFSLNDGIYNLNGVDLKNFTGTLTLYRNDLVKTGEADGNTTFATVENDILTLNVVNGVLKNPVSEFLLDHGDYFWKWEMAENDSSAFDITLKLTGEVFSIEPDDREIISIGDDTVEMPLVGGAYVETLEGEVGFCNKDAVYQYMTDDGGELSITIKSGTVFESDVDLSIYMQDYTDGEFDCVKTMTVKAGEYTEDTALIDRLVIKNNFHIQVAAPDEGKGEYNTEYSFDLSFDIFEDSVQAEDILTVNGEAVKDWIGYRNEEHRYLLQIKTDDRYALRLNGDAHDAILKICEVNGSVIEEKQIGVNGIASIDDIYLKSGNYFVMVNSADSGDGQFNTDYALGAYELKTLYPLIDNSDDTLELAVSKDSSAFNSNIENWLGTGDKADFYKFTLAPESQQASTLILTVDAKTAQAVKDGLLEINCTDRFGQELELKALSESAWEIDPGIVSGDIYVGIQRDSTVEDMNYSFKVSNVIVPGNLSGSTEGVSWDVVPGASKYIVEYSQDNFENVLCLETLSNKVDFFDLPAGVWQWRVKAFGAMASDSEQVITSGNLTVQKLVSEANGNTDMFFANANGKWESGYAAQHTGIRNGWNGTSEQVTLTGKNKLADIFEGSSDANILLLTDDANGDALFVDDIYTALPGTVAEQQARIAKIDEIRAGNGDDIVDMTSRRFAYIGDGVKIYGGLGDDTIWANNGNNALFGDAGNDRLVGGANNDVIVGGIGNDRMHGGGGEDIFCFGKNWGKDTVEQLVGGEITLWFESGEISNWNADTLTYSDGTNSVKVSGVSNDNITLIFGDDGSLRYDELATVGCFDDAASEKIFEDKNKGMLA
jgi:Ca2+-binding RTX toxin-like protein